MHPITVKEIVDRCRRRQSEGAHPTVPPFSVKLLQDCVIQLSAALDRTASKAWLLEYSALNAVPAVGAPPEADSSEDQPKLVAPEVDLDELETVFNNAAFGRSVIPSTEGVVVGLAVLRSLIAELRELRGKAEWRPVLDATGNVQVDEGKSYLFAIQVTTNGAPLKWKYFQDAIVWDAKTEPDFRDDNGWAFGDELYFRELPSPPEETT